MKKKHTRILLVDDEPDIIEILAYNLSNEGYQIETAINGRDALEKANDWKPHLVLLDVMMPEMDGIETCEQLRKNSSLSNLVIVFLTARSEDYSQVAGLEAGADDYITKPIKPKVLTSKIKDFEFKNSLLSDKIDLDYVETLIREKFLFGKEGETLYIIKKNDN